MSFRQVVSDSCSKFCGPHDISQLRGDEALLLDSGTSRFRGRSTVFLMGGRLVLGWWP
jgi:hypothetical protein